jgi:putative phosphoesterase
MRLAVISDIHGNAPALEAVLHAIRAENADGIVVGGDVTAGPMPSETLTLLMESGIPTQFVRGNHDSDIQRALAREEPGGMSERADEVARWVAAKLSPAHKQLVSSWQSIYEIEMDGWGNVLFCHATANSDTYAFSRLTPEAKLLPIFQDLNVALMVCAHTHMQFDRMIAGIRVVNAGSVGMAIGRTGADWLLIDDDVHFRHSDYDLAKAAAQIRQSDYPYAEEFVENNVLQSPPESKMFGIIALLEANQAEIIA